MRLVAGVPENFPGKPFIVTESVSGLMTRGYYRMPSDSMFIWPERWDKPFYDASFSCSSYDNCHVPWGNRHEGTMRHVKNKRLYQWDNTSGRASIISVSLLLTVGRHVALTLALSTWLASRRTSTICISPSASGQGGVASFPTLELDGGTRHRFVGIL